MRIPRTKDNPSKCWEFHPCPTVKQNKNRKYSCVICDDFLTTVIVMTNLPSSLWYGKNIRILKLRHFVPKNVKKLFIHHLPHSMINVDICIIKGPWDYFSNCIKYYFLLDNLLHLLSLLTTKITENKGGS